MDWAVRTCVEDGLAKTDEVVEALRVLLADVFTLYVKTKNFHWHVGGPHFRDHHLLLDEQAEQLYAMTDVIAERARKLGGTTLHSIGEIERRRRLKDSDEVGKAADSMLAELRSDNERLRSFLVAAHDACESAGDIATESLIENWVDETERRTWFLSETLRKDAPDR
jgi:starvation-inducible DNA-binding protein